MTERSGYWGGLVTGDATLAPYDDAEFAFIERLKALADITTQGIICGYSNELLTVGSSSPLTVSPGAAVINGWWYYSDDNENIAVSTPAVSTRQDYIVLHKEAAAQTVRLKVVQGVEGGGLPSLTQGANIFQVPIYSLTITTAGAITLTDLRAWATSPLAGQYQESELAADDSSHSAAAWNDLGASNVQVTLFVGTWKLEGFLPFSYNTSPTVERRARLYNNTTSAVITTVSHRLFSPGSAGEYERQHMFLTAIVTVTAKNIVKLQFYAGAAGDVVHGASGSYGPARLTAIRLSATPATS